MTDTGNLITPEVKGSRILQPQNENRIKSPRYICKARQSFNDKSWYWHLNLHYTWFHDNIWGHHSRIYWFAWLTQLVLTSNYDFKRSSSTYHLFNQKLLEVRSHISHSHWYRELPSKYEFVLAVGMPKNCENTISCIATKLLQVQEEIDCVGTLPGNNTTNAKWKPAECNQHKLINLNEWWPDR